MKEYVIPLVGPLKTMEQIQTVTIGVILLLSLAGGSSLNNIDDRSEVNADSIEEDRERLADLEDMDNSMQAKSNQLEGMITMNVQSIQMLSDDVALLIDGPQWVSETGNSSNPWTLSLTDTEWLEVSSAVWIGQTPTRQNLLGIHEEGGWMAHSSTSDNAGNEVWTGPAAVFGGNWFICQSTSDYRQSGTCDTSGISEWSVIYRVHEVGNGVIP